MANLPNHLTLSMLTKGHLFSDTLTRGYIIAVNTYLLTDGPSPPIPVPPDIIGGGGGGGFPPPFYEDVKKKIEKGEKIKEIHLRLIRNKKIKNYEIHVQLLEATLKAELIEHDLLSDSGFKITVEWTDI